MGPPTSVDEIGTLGEDSNFLLHCTQQDGSPWNAKRRRCGVFRAIRCDGITFGPGCLNQQRTAPFHGPAARTLVANWASTFREKLVTTGPAQAVSVTTRPQGLRLRRRAPGRTICQDDGLTLTSPLSLKQDIAVKIAQNSDIDHVLCDICYLSNFLDRTMLA